MSTFDADAFMNTTVDSAGSTEAPKTPEGEFRAVIGELTKDSLKTVSWNDDNTGEKISRQVLEVPMVIRDQEINAKTQRDVIVHRESFFLDFTQDGRLDMGEGKNTRLNQLRDVLGQNVPGWSPMHLSNAGPFIMAVKHTPGKGKHDGKTFVNVTKYAKIS